MEERPIEGSTPRILWQSIALGLFDVVALSWASTPYFSMETAWCFGLDMNCYNFTMAESMPIPSASIFYVPSNPFGVWPIILASTYSTSHILEVLPLVKLEALDTLVFDINEKRPQTLLNKWVKNDQSGDKSQNSKNLCHSSSRWGATLQKPDALFRVGSVSNKHLNRDSNPPRG